MVSGRTKKDSQDHHGRLKMSPDSRFKRDDEDIRVYAAITFAFLLIVIGIPLWWKTTEVYRVHVPYGRIDDLKEIDIVFPIHVTVVSKDDSRINSIINHLSASVSSGKNGIVDVQFSKGTINMEEILTAASLKDIDELNPFPSTPGQLVLLEVPGMLRFTLSNIVLGSKRILYFSQETSEQLLESVVHQWLIQADALFRTRAAMEAPNEWVIDKTGRRRMPPAAQYDLMVSVVHPEPERRDILWDVQRAVKDYMGHLIEALSPVMKLRTKSQWLYLVRLEGRPRQVPTEGVVWYSLSEDVLPHVITPLEKKLGSGVGQNPTIQLVLYIPPCQTSPLLITSNRHNLPPSTAFLSPRWGGVQIYNPPLNTCENTDEGKGFRSPHEPDSRAIMVTFRKQLKLLLGIPELVPIPGVEQLPLPPRGIRDWELDSLMRMRALEHLISARLTLKSLAQLLDEISNIVITDEVGARIWEAITRSHDSINHILASELHMGFNASRDAFLAAETAFSDPSLLALLYFPDDQKYAVYIPLFLPVMIPVLMSLKSIRTWWLTGTTEKREEKEKRE